MNMVDIETMWPTTSNPALSPPQAELSPWSRFYKLLPITRGRRVVMLLVALAILNAFDLILTILAYRCGLIHESNPIAARILPMGPFMIATYKTGLILIASVCLFITRQRVMSEITVSFMFMMYALVAVQWKLCYEWYEVTCASGLDNLEPYGTTWVSQVPF